MADNYLEDKYEDYLKRKAAWEKARKQGHNVKKTAVVRPLDKMEETDSPSNPEEDDDE